MDSGTIDRDGFALEWIREGAGIPMLVVGTHRYYRRLFPARLRDAFDIVFCDSRQWVPTPHGFDISTLTINTFADDIDAVRETMGLERPLVVGHSQHGALAFEYARLHPEHVRGVVAVAPNPPIGSGDGLESAEEFFRRDASKERRSTHDRNRAERRIPETVHTPDDFVDAYVANGALGWFDPMFDASPLWEGVTINLEVVAQLFAPEGLGGFRLPRLDVPVFLALGRFDYGLPYYFWDEPKKRLSQLHYRLYGSSGHNPPYEQPDEFTRDVIDWAGGLE